MARESVDAVVKTTKDEVRPTADKTADQDPTCKVCGKPFTPTAPRQTVCRGVCSDTVRDAIVRGRPALYV
jgi:hypothetical protein